MPTAIAWWPVAPGWYVLGILVIFISIMTIWFLRASRINSRAKREALAILSIYQQQHQHDNNAVVISAQISALLKRVALAYFPREQVANLQGMAWINFLNATSKKLDFNQIQQALVVLPYQPTSSQSIDLNLFFTMARQWIKQRRGRCLN